MLSLHSALLVFTFIILQGQRHRFYAKIDLQAAWLLKPFNAASLKVICLVTLRWQSSWTSLEQFCSYHTYYCLFDNKTTHCLRFSAVERPCRYWPRYWWKKTYTQRHTHTNINLHKINFKEKSTERVTCDNIHRDKVSCNISRVQTNIARCWAGDVGTITLHVLVL